MSKETDFEKALRLKGYGSFEKKYSKSDKKRIEAVKKVGDLRVKPKVITSLKDYIEFIETLETSYENPVFYRGQGNANYLINSGALRINPENELKMIDSFTRRFSTDIDSCVNNMDRLILMQHFGLPTRALDITENPLGALYFACSPMKKFNKNPQSELDAWGEIIVFKEPDELKKISSTTVSVIASTAFMESDFNLWKLGMEYKKDNNYDRDESYIPLKDILRRSVIVRVPQNNPRIKNQQGAFILINASKVKSINKNEEKAEELTDFILSNEDEIHFIDLTNSKKWSKLFSEDQATWELEFTKIKPYSDENKNKIFDTDPFDLHRLFYKDENGNQLVALIPPDAKSNITKELARFNITEDFIYPDMDNVANEIKEQINK